MSIVSVTMDYIKKVPDVCAPHLEKSESYVKFGGGTAVRQDLILDHPNVVDKIVALAVLYAHRDAGQVQDWQTQMQQIISVDKVIT